MKTMLDAAVYGIDITIGEGVVCVRHGENVWLCDKRTWEAVAKQFQSLEMDHGDTGGVEAYSLFCRKVRSRAVGFASTGEYRAVTGACSCAMLTTPN